MSTKDYFALINKLNIDTGLKKKKSATIVSVIKEDRQAFGLIISKGISLWEAFQYPITNIPLSLATADNQLNQGPTSILRNFIINETGATTIHPLHNAGWIVDGIAAM